MNCLSSSRVALPVLQHCKHLVTALPSAQRATAGGATAPAAPQQLSYAEYGDPRSSRVVFFQHGWPGSRVGGAMLHDAAAALGVRVVAVDRPGFGRTPFDASQPHTLASWAGCVRHLADQLGVRTFAVLGASGGAPFAAAAARFAPPGRVTGLGLLCPLGPPAAGAVAARDAALLALARTWPRAARTLWRIGRLWLRWDEAAMSRLAQHPADRAAFAAAPAAAATIRAAVLEGLHSGGWGVVHEMALVQRCWGFALSDITVPRAFVWHGLADPLVPLGMARAYESIPGCRASYFDGETHSSLVLNRLNAALGALVAPQPSQPGAGL